MYLVDCRVLTCHRRLRFRPASLGRPVLTKICAWTPRRGTREPSKPGKAQCGQKNLAQEPTTAQGGKISATEILHKDTQERLRSVQKEIQTITMHALAYKTASENLQKEKKESDAAFTAPQELSSPPHYCSCFTALAW